MSKYTRRLKRELLAKQTAAEKIPAAENTHLGIIMTTKDKTEKKGEK